MLVSGPTVGNTLYPELKLIGLILLELWSKPLYYKLLKCNANSLCLLQFVKIMEHFGLIKIIIVEGILMAENYYQGHQV